MDVAVQYSTSVETSAALLQPAAASQVAAHAAIGPSQLTAKRGRRSIISVRSGSVEALTYITRAHTREMMKNMGISPQCSLTSVTATAAAAGHQKAAHKFINRPWLCRKKQNKTVFRLEQLKGTTRQIVCGASYEFIRF